MPVRRSRIGRALLIAAALFVLAPATLAQAASESASTTKWPWAGYWWPMYEPYKNLYDDGEAMQQYDAYVKASRGQNAGAQNWERTYHFTTEKKNDWWGHCHAWAAAAMLTKEPPATATRNGVTFDSDDLRGLVTELYYQPRYNWLSGVRADSNDKNTAAYKDMNPAWMDYLLRFYVGYYKYSFVMDISADSQVWNFPAFAYTRDATRDANGVETVSTKVWYGDPANGATGSKYFTRTYTYTLRHTQQGYTGEWTGNSIDDHPDFAWLPTGKTVRGPVTEAVVEEIIGNGYDA